jgi:pyruvate dehydrogenase E2 component (dihydrolipoamide acetyltransferase)
VRGIYGTPIINYPEVAILGIGRIQEIPVAKDGKIEVRKILPLALSFDHRVVDGAEAARFLNTVILRLEDPDLILLET